MASPPAPQHTDQTVCATEHDVFVLPPDLQVSHVLTCTADLEEQIEDEMAKPDAVIAVRINTAADLDAFGAAQYAIHKPLCIVCEDADLLDRALALYQGRALYAGALPDEALLPLANKYGLII